MDGWMDGCRARKPSSSTSQRSSFVVPRDVSREDDRDDRDGGGGVSRRRVRDVGAREGVPERGRRARRRRDDGNGNGNDGDVDVETVVDAVRERARVEVDDRGRARVRVRVDRCRSIERVLRRERDVDEAVRVRRVRRAGRVLRGVRDVRVVLFRTRARSKERDEETREGEKSSRDWVFR